MFTALNKLWSAVAVLTSSILNLAGVLDGGAAKLRQHFALDGEPGAAPRVIEHRADAPELRPAADAEADAPSGKAARNGRAKATA